MRVYHEIAKNEDGFTLIEMAIVITIVGIMIAGFTTGFVLYLDQAKTNVTDERIEKIREAVNIYLEINGKLPCVARLSNQIDAGGFGKEIKSGDCSDSGVPNGTFQDTTFSVRIGAVPVRSLNIPDEYMFDGWGNRFLYAVQEQLATDGQYDGIGQITVVDSASNIVTNSAHFVILSVGEDGAGGYNKNGKRVGPCADDTKLDGENCDEDGRFRSTLLFADTDANTHFDDIIYYQSQTSPNEPIPAGAVMAFQLNACPDGWREFGRARGRFIIGSGNFDNENYTYNGRNWSSGARTYVMNNRGGYANWLQGEDEIAEHSHTVPILSRSGYSTLLGGRDAADTDSSAAMDTSIEGGTTPMENIPPYLALLYCIKE